MQITRLTHDGYITDVISPDARLLAFVLIENGKQSLWISNWSRGKDGLSITPIRALLGLTLLTRWTKPFLVPSTQLDHQRLFRVSLRGGPLRSW